MDASASVANLHFHLPAGRKLGQMFVVLMIAPLVLLFAGVALFVLLQQQLGLAAFLVLVTAWMLIMLCYVARIETRLEAVKSLGMVNMQRWYALRLRLRSGQCIMLGEERALGTPLATTFWGSCVAAIVERYDLTVEDLGMVPAQGGFLSALATRPPAQDAVPLSATTQQALWRRAQISLNQNCQLLRPYL